MPVSFSYEFPSIDHLFPQDKPLHSAENLQKLVDMGFPVSNLTAMAVVNSRDYLLLIGDMWIRLRRHG